MKVVYNWLKDFVEVAATPEELASRLALSGTNIAGVENGPHGAVIDAEDSRSSMTSPSMRVSDNSASICSLPWCAAPSSKRRASPWSLGSTFGSSK